MITTMITGAVGFILTAIFYFLPVVTIADLPLFGEELADLLVTVITTWNAFLVTFPYAVVVWNMFLFVVMPFEILMLVAKFFFGHRLPANS